MTISSVLSNKYLFLTVLETGKSEIKRLVWLDYSENPLPGFLIR